MRYRAYFLDESYRYVDARNIDGDSDRSAVAQATRIVEEMGFSDFEVWQGPRSVHLCQQHAVPKAVTVSDAPSRFVPLDGGPSARH